MKVTEKAPRGTKCSLCGEKKSGVTLIRTKCCNNWICNDAHKYMPFDYYGSCFRNHNRYTSCAFHFIESHIGKWQDYDVCKKYGDEQMFHLSGKKSAPKKVATPKMKTPNASSII